MTIRNFTLALGVLFLAVGIMGFIPLFISYPTLYEFEFNPPMDHGLLLGLFPVNWLHNLVHVAFGIWAIAAARMSAAAAKNFCKSVSVVYAVMAVLGLFPQTNTLFGHVPLYSNDIWLHGLISLAAAYYGFVWHTRWAGLHIHKNIHPRSG